MKTLTTLLLLSIAAASIGRTAPPARLPEAKAIKALKEAEAIKALKEAEAIKALKEAEAIKALKAELEVQTADGRFSGAVLVVRAGNPIFQQAYGYADRDRKIRNKIDTKFRVLIG